MSQIRSIFANFVTQIEAIVCDTRYDGTLAYKHDVEALDGSGLTRARTFCLVDTGQRERLGAIGPTTSPSEFRTTLEVHAYYPAATHAYETARVIAEDVDRLNHQLDQPSGYDQATTRLYGRAVQGATIVRPTEGDGGLLLVVPVEIIYRPEF